MTTNTPPTPISTKFKLSIPSAFQAFTDLRPTRRLILALYGPSKSGKTHFSLASAVPPVFHIILDPNAEEIGKKITREFGQEIYRTRVKFSRDMTQAACTAEWRSLESSYDAALKVGRGTLVVDSATEMDQLFRLHHYGKLDQVPGYKYQERNKQWKSMINDAYDSDMSVLFIQKLKDEYVNDTRTGGKVRDGWPSTEFEVQGNIAFSWLKGEFSVRVDNNNMSMGMSGVEYPADYMTLGQMLEDTFGPVE